LDNLLQTVNTVLSISEHILVNSLDTLVVILKSMLNLISWVFSIFKTPCFRVINGALWWFVMIRFWLMISCRSMMNRGMVYGVVNRGSMMHWSPMVDKSSRVMDRGCMVHRFRLMIRCRLVVRFWGRVIDRGSVVNRLNRAISWGGGVTIYWGIGVDCGHSH